MIQHKIFIRCDDCDRRWGEAIPAVQKAGIPIQLRSVICTCGADFHRINISTPATETANVKP